MIDEKDYNELHTRVLRDRFHVSFIKIIRYRSSMKGNKKNRYKNQNITAHTTNTVHEINGYHIVDISRKTCIYIFIPYHYYFACKTHAAPLRFISTLV